MTYVVTMGQPATHAGALSPADADALAVVGAGAAVGLVAHFVFGVGWLSAAALGALVPGLAWLIAVHQLGKLGS